MEFYKIEVLLIKLLSKKYFLYHDMWRNNLHHNIYKKKDYSSMKYQDLCLSIIILKYI